MSYDVNNQQIVLPEISIPRRRSWWQKLLRWQHLGICVLTLTTLVMHITLIMLPNQVIFDEQFYVEDARRISQGLGSQRGEHPPLGKLLVLAGDEILGDNAFGWRIFPIIFGTASIIMFYFICRRLRLSQTATLLATFFMAFENMSFIQAQIAMLDVFMVGLLVAAFLFYVHEEYALAAVFIAFSALAKISGALGIVVIIMHWWLARRDRKLHFALSMLLVPITFMIFLPLLNYFIDGKLVNPVHLFHEISKGTASLTFSWVTHPAASKPWTWITTNHEIFYWIKPRYMGTLSYSTWALIVPSTLYMIYRGLRNNVAALFGLCWVLGTYYIWMPAVLITDRVTYPFYIYPAVGALSIGIGMGLKHILDIGRKKWRGKLFWLSIVIVVLVCLAHAVAFGLMSPIFTRW